jgi:hypothetical protein
MVGVSSFRGTRIFLIDIRGVDATPFVRTERNIKQHWNHAKVKKGKAVAGKIATLSSKNNTGKCFKFKSFLKNSKFCVESENKIVFRPTNG